MTETPEKPEMPEMNDKRDRFVDDLLDSALAQYAQAEPRPGLEGRLLARLRSEPEPATLSWRWLPMAAAAAAVVAAVLYLASSREARPVEVAVEPHPAVAPAVAPPTVTPTPAPNSSVPAVSHAAGRAPSAPRAPATAPTSISARREQFPSPMALSEQEQLLLRFVKQTPPQELQALAREARAEPIKDLHVEALSIPPVVVGEADSQ